MSPTRPPFKRLITTFFEMNADEATDRIIVSDNYGRYKIKRINKRKSVGFIKLHYCSRALEWLNLRKIFQQILTFFHFSHLCSIVDDITFAWSYTDNLATVFYKPVVVFKSFSFTDLLDEKMYCACRSTARLKRFLDPLTINESSLFSRNDLHVRSMDMEII